MTARVRIEYLEHMNMKRSHAGDIECESDEEEEMMLLALGMLCAKKQRAPALFRKRWDSEYLLDLAQKEGSFVAEYRVDPAGFRELV